MNHTPGPWIFNSFSYEVNDPRSVTKTQRGYFVQKQKGFDICQLPLQASTPADETKANARLIAAAPELLEALLRFARAMEQTSYPELQGIWSDANAAIAKAVQS